ncbi:MULTISPECIES: ssl1498 family light-harvesting-like protein [unclassified Leptolyngbya]|uniref:photosystem II assembly protein Psb34 n=1 Tax=unclassified Leptolyngbya TaxID=2650499 RepID=UPI001683AF77|nr:MULTISPECIES: ssl1498 family light-harvesting-like protein [unclassified Leptolyngbya]MBD1912215.1 ssl1498 family light-harvesting-like protein [Leptolyngbya sp. FACHB-8]MBD2155106.1 ssl1498 family light-harvesting-like protein [Leptolyngbya sp. FACHB-16]
MRYTSEEGGRLNNFAVEPKMYQAEPPTQKQKTTYLVLGIGAAVLVGSLLWIAVAVS